MSGENTRYADRLLQQAVFVFTFINPTSVFRRMDMLPHMGAAKTIEVMHMIALAWCDWMHTYHADVYRQSPSAFECVPTTTIVILN